MRQWRYGIRWSLTTLLSQMTTTNIKYGSNVTVSSGHPNVPLKGSVLVKLSTEVVITQAATVKANAQKRVVCKLTVDMWRGLTSGSGRFDNGSFDQWSRADDERPRGLGASDTPAVHVDRNMSGEEAFQRRLAMSAGAVARVPSPTPVPVDHNLSGEEAYQRRLAMASSKLRPTASPFESSSRPPAPVNQPVQPVTSVPPMRSPPPLAYNPFAPPANIPPPPPPPSSQIPVALEDKVKAAAIVAARLGALAATSGGSGPGSSVPGPSPEEDAQTRYAWVYIYYRVCLTMISVLIHRVLQLV